ncbi:MAG: hypothetical protein SGI86_13175 [Deltaproteobacteria bacterium]|nr:hypothetical protein [Deltaproteobacteria bacterium]
MIRYRVAEARKQISRVLDDAEKGNGVLIERKGVLFRVLLETPNRLPPRSRRPPPIEVLDPAVEAGNWSWDVQAKGGLKFVATRKKRSLR